MKRLISILLILFTCSSFSQNLAEMDKIRQQQVNDASGGVYVGRKQAIDIDYTFGSALSNFPMLITLDHLNTEVVDAGSVSALNGGGDLRFYSDASLTNRLACDVVRFVTNATAGSRDCEIWVKIPSVNTGSTIYVYYNQGETAQPSPDATYGSEAVWTDYEAVWHFDEDPFTYAAENSQGNANFDGDNNQYETADYQDLDFGKGYVADGVAEYTAWTNAMTPDATSTFQIRASIQTHTSSFGPLFIQDAASSYGFWIDNDRKMNFWNGSDNKSNTVMTNDVFYNMAWVQSGSNILTYLDGAADGTITGGDMTVYGLNSMFRSNGGGNYLAISMEEARLATVSRTAGFLLAEKVNWDTPATFASAGTSSNASTPASELYSQNNAASFYEEANATTGWTATEVTLTSDATAPQHGSYNLKLVATEGNYDRATYDFSATIGDTFDISWYSKKTTGTNQRVWFVGFDTNPLVNVTETSWTYHTVSVTATATGTVTIWASAIVNDLGAIGDDLELDKFSIVKTN